MGTVILPATIEPGPERGTRGARGAENVGALHECDFSLFLMFFEGNQMSKLYHATLSERPSVCASAVFKLFLTIPTPSIPSPFHPLPHLPSRSPLHTCPPPGHTDRCFAVRADLLLSLFHQLYSGHLPFPVHHYLETSCKSEWFSSSGSPLSPVPLSPMSQ